MTDNNNNLNEEQLTMVAGGKELEPHIHDDVTYMLEKILVLNKLFFDPIHEEEYPGLKKLHRYILTAYTAETNSYRKQRVYLAIWAANSLSNTRRYSNDPILIEIKDSLLEIQKIIGLPDR